LVNNVDFLKVYSFVRGSRKNLATPLPVCTGWALLPRIEPRFLDYPSHVVITVLPELPPVRSEYVEE
jgi:hypothetical protein